MKYSELVKSYEKLESTSKRLEKTYIISDLLKKTKREDIKQVIYLLQGKVFPLWDRRKIGFSIRLAIKAISSATGTQIEKVEKDLAKKGDIGLVAEDLIKGKKQTTLSTKDINIEKVFDNIRKLTTLEGHGTVNKKIRLVTELLTSSSPNEAKFIVRTIMEQLRVGVSSGILRDAITWTYLPRVKNINDKDIKTKKTLKVKSLEDVKSKNLNKIKLIDSGNEKTNRDIYNYFIKTAQQTFDTTNDFVLVVESLQKHGLKAKEQEIRPGNPINSMLAVKVESIKEAFDAVGKPTFFDQKIDGFRCIGGSTPLYIKDKGLLSVRDIQTGDYVLTHKGEFKKIKAVNKRTVDKNEKIYKVQTFLGHQFKITEKHKILIFRNGKLRWISVEKVKKSDKAVFPIPKINKESLLKNRLMLKNTSGYRKNIKINQFFFRFLGFWLGDGFTNNYHNTERVGLLFNSKKERKLADYYKENIKKYFRIDKISEYYSKGGYLSIHWRDKPLRQWMSKHFRREWRGKMLPDWFYGISDKQFNMFLKGWMEADGHTDRFGRMSVTTKERDLAMFAQLLCLKNHKIASIRRQRIKGKNYYTLYFPKSSRAATIKDNHVLVSIMEINKIKSDPRFKVYNLQVEKDKSYCVPMISLHNCQIHKYNNKITLFTRRLENVTKQFPDLVEFVKKHIKAKSFIIDAEAAGYDPKTKNLMPFQAVSQRIKRKYHIEDMIKKLPVQLFVFDILYHNGKNLMQTSFKERRRILEEITKQERYKIVLTEKLITDSKKKAEEFYDKVLKQGHEGLIGKNIEATYKPGRYVQGWVKLKPVLEPLDLVIVAADYGEGKRAGWLTSYTLACKKNKEFVTMGKASTGLKEKAEGLSFKDMTKILKPLIKEQKGKHVKVKPEVIIEVAYEEIQKSPTYESGFALRFPRLLRNREDLSLKDCDDIERVKKLYDSQKGKKK